MSQLMLRAGFRLSAGILVVRTMKPSETHLFTTRWIPAEHCTESRWRETGKLAQDWAYRWLAWMVAMSGSMWPLHTSRSSRPSLS